MAGKRGREQLLEEEAKEEEEEDEEPDVEAARKTKKVKAEKGKQKRSTFTTKELLIIEMAMLKNEGRDFIDVKSALTRLPQELQDAHTKRSIEKKAREIWQTRKRQAAERLKIEEEEKLKKQQKLVEEEEAGDEVEEKALAPIEKQAEESLLLYNPLNEFRQPSNFHPIALEQNSFLYLYWPVAPTFVGYKVHYLVEPYRVSLRVLTTKLTREELDLATEAFGERLPMPEESQLSVTALTLAWRSTKRLDQEQVKDHQTPHFFLLRIRIIPDEAAVRERSDISIHKYIQQLGGLLNLKKPQAEVEIVAELPALEDRKTTNE
jgi:hypothetical protein